MPSGAGSRVDVAGHAVARARSRRDDRGFNMPVSASELVRYYKTRQQRAWECTEAYQDLQKQMQDWSQGYQEEVRAAHVALARAYLPELSRAALDRAERLTGFRGFRTHDPFKAMDHERAVLERAIARIRADQRYVQRDVLAGPEGTLRQELDQAREMLAPFDSECQRFESLDGFTELLMIGYDTPGFAGKWWQKDYWRHWALGDRICAELGMKDFGDDVLPAYAKAAEPRDFWRAEVARHEVQLSQVHALVEDHDQAVARLGNLPAIILEQAQGLLAEYLALADLQLLDEWLRQEPEDRAIRMAMRNAAGLRAKKQFLAELAQGLSTVISSLNNRTRKYGRKATKFSRPKYAGHRYPDDWIQDGFDAKHAKLLQRRSKLIAMAERIRRYDRYGDFDLQNDHELWWMELVGKPPPRLMPELCRYYQRHPERTPRHDPLDSYQQREHEHAAAVAQAAQATQALMAHELDDMGYLS